MGAGNFRTSTLLRKINRGDIKGACDQLRRWAYAGDVSSMERTDETRRELSVRSLFVGVNNEQGNRDYLRSGYLHHRLPVMGW